MGCPMMHWGKARGAHPSLLTGNYGVQASSLLGPGGGRHVAGLLEEEAGGWGTPCILGVWSGVSCYVLPGQGL